MKQSKPTGINAKHPTDKYLNKPVTYDICGLKVTAKPLKLRWKLLTAGITYRIQKYCKAESGLTDEEYQDPDFAGFLQVFEDSFFSFHYEPKGEPSGKENLVEILSACANEDINWSKFISDKLKGKPEAKQIELYNQIRKAGMGMYRDFFLEILTLKMM
jgi:hypothetical protein